jgi:hypothetical protein
MFLDGIEKLFSGDDVLTYLLNNLVNEHAITKLDNICDPDRLQIHARLVMLPLNCMLQ